MHPCSSPLAWLSVMGPPGWGLRNYTLHSTKASATLDGVLHNPPLIAQVRLLFRHERLKGGLARQRTRGNWIRYNGSALTASTGVVGCRNWFRGWCYSSRDAHVHCPVHGP